MTRVKAVVVTHVLVLALCGTAAAQGWTDVSSSVTETQTRPEFDRINKILASHATVTNTSGGALDDTLRLVIADCTLPVTNADGRTGSYEPYFEIPALADGESATVRVTFPWVRAPLSYTPRLEQLAPTATSLAIVSGPTLTMDPNAKTPLAGVVEAETNIASRATLTITGAGDLFTVEYPEYQTNHYLLVLGLKPGNIYSVDVEFFDQVGGSISSGGLQAVAPALPADFPNVTVFVSTPSLMEPGFTLIDRFRREPGNPDPAYAIIFNADGDVVWFTHGAGGDMEQAPSGALRLGPGSTAYEWDMLGTRTSSIPLTGFTTGLHHDLFHTIYGTFMGLDRNLIIESDYPTSETDPEAPTAEATLRDEPVVEFDRDGNLLNTWPMAGLIDTTRIGYDALNLFPDGSQDWVHSNAVWHDPRDDSVLVSLRHQDAVLKFSRYTGELIWILGNHANWKPAWQPFLLTPVGSPFDWQYHQHAPMVTGDGTILLFDNGNYRASPFDGNPKLPDDQSASRAVEYAIDEANMEVTEVWEWGLDVPDPLYSYYISDADWQPQTGNILIDFGGHTYYDHELIATFGWGERAVRIVEVTHDTPAVKVFDLIMYNPDPIGRIASFRAERIPSLYPPHVTVTGP
jgi:arylsulfate sulfotransferase